MPWGRACPSIKRFSLAGWEKIPETRYTSAGQAVCTFSLATDETYKDRNGERQKRTEWHRITMWGKLAEIAQKYLKKGQLVFIEGRIQSRQWDDKTTGQNATRPTLSRTKCACSLRARNRAAARGRSSSAGGDDFSQGTAAEFQRWRRRQRAAEFRPGNIGRRYSLLISASGSRHQFFCAVESQNSFLNVKLYFVSEALSGGIIG